MEDSQYFSHILAGTKYYKKSANNDTQLDFEFKAGNNEEYKINGIWNSAVYAKESTID